MKRTVRLSLGLCFIMLALVLIAPHLASPELVLRFLPKDVYEAGKTDTVPDLLCSPCISAYKKGKVEAVLAQKLIQSRKRQYIKVMHRLFFVQNNALETFVVVVPAGP